MTPSPAPASESFLRPGRWLAPAAWGLVAFTVYYHYAQFVGQVGWNAIELIISQKLTGHGVYATSLDYPSAIAWRPVVPTLVVTLLRFLTEDPIRIYQLACGLSFGALTVAMFLSGRLLGNAWTGHLAALAAATCPAVTTYLVHHIHSYSHVVTLGFLGPAIYVSLVLIQADPAGPAPSLRRHVVAGLLWGLAYLCRSEMLLFFGVFVVVLAWRQRRSLSRLKPLLGALGAFLLLFGSYNTYAGGVTAREGILIRKTIYGFYISQGWADPAPDTTPDIEADGYTYAIKLYGDPKGNGESLVRAIRRNPAAFLRRVRLNAGHFYERFFDGGFVAPWVTVPGLLLALALVAGAVDPARRAAAVFLLGLFAATNFILIFHIDARYLTIAVPPLLLAAALLVQLGLDLFRRRVAAVPGWVPAVLVLAAVAWASRGQTGRLWPRGQPTEAGTAAMKVFGDHFRALVRQPRLTKNTEPHVVLVYPPQSALRPEDQFLLAYYCGTAWVNRGAEGKFPRGVFYSFRDCEDDYVYAPAGYQDEPRFGRARRLGELTHPTLGRYVLYEMHP